MTKQEAHFKLNKYFRKFCGGQHKLTLSMSVL